MSFGVANAIEIESSPNRPSSLRRYPRVESARERVLTGKRVIVYFVYYRVDSAVTSGCHCECQRNRYQPDALSHVSHQLACGVTPCGPASLAVFAEIQISRHRVASNPARESVSQPLAADRQCGVKLSLIAVDGALQLPFECPSNMGPGPCFPLWSETACALPYPIRSERTHPTARRSLCWAPRGHSPSLPSEPIERSASETVGDNLVVVRSHCRRAEWRMSVHSGSMGHDSGLAIKQQPADFPGRKSHLQRDPRRH